MKYRNIVDMHTHSDNSFDGNHSCILMCEGVIANGGMGIAITDHCDIDAVDYDFRAFATNQYVQTYTAKKAFEGDLLVLQGIELGQGIFRKEKAVELMNNFSYDFVLGSIHNLENMQDFYFLDYKQYDIDNLLKKYFIAELELAQWNKTDSLAHLTYPLRYIVAREHIDVDITKYYDIIDSIFETLIKNNKALELNVSGLFMDMNDTLPNMQLIKRFHDMGGQYVTVGTDSHYYNKVCIGIDKGLDILKQCGYDCFTIFQKREPILIPIE
ncbi:MAG: histidinol-phosphatase HisJ family protein [Eubacterium sp.]